MAIEWVVVTGAAHGIGKVIAQHAVKAGYRVAAWDLDRAGLAALQQELGEACTTQCVDVADEDSVEPALDTMPAAPRLVVNSAGIVRFGPLLELSVPDWAAAIKVNLTGTFIVGRATARRMMNSGGGSIVNLASVNGIAAAPNSGGYGASKAGVVMLTEQMAMEWADKNIRVNAVAPGLIDAGMSDAIYADPQVRRLRQERVPIGRLGTAEDVAAAVLFLGSDKAAYLTAQTLTVDGGLTRSTLASMPRPESVDSVGIQ